MIDVQKLIGELARQEQDLRGRRFLAPRVQGGRVRTRVAGMVYTFRAQPDDCQGWGVFQPRDARVAQWLEQAQPHQVGRYLGLLLPVRLHLLFPLHDASWLAYPVNESDARQRLGNCRPATVHLVTGGATLETVLARWDGAAFWFEATDRGADPRLAEQARHALNRDVPADTLRVKGLTPELRTGYALARDRHGARRVRERLRGDHARLRRALAFAGGELEDFQDRGGHWAVRWRTSDGRSHHSAIAKADLSVIGAGICLDGQDRRFDLQSLVGVVARAPEWAQE